MVGVRRGRWALIVAFIWSIALPTFLPLLAVSAHRHTPHPPSMRQRIDRVLDDAQRVGKAKRDKVYEKTGGRKRAKRDFDYLRAKTRWRPREHGRQVADVKDDGVTYDVTFYPQSKTGPPTVRIWIRDRRRGIKIRYP